MRGKVFQYFSRLKFVQDHPRLCGEKREQRAARISEIGSPPPMRGKDADLSGGGVGEGITPAYAGKSDMNDYKNFMS